MHEWALAESVVTAATEYAQEEGIARITRVVIHVGELQQIETDVFMYALNEVIASQKAAVRGAVFEVKSVPATLRCRACATTWPFRDALDALGEERSEAIHFVPELAHTYLRCPSCGSPDFEVQTGRGVSIGAIEGEKPG